MGCVCCFVPVGVLLVMFVGALLLRLGVVIANRTLGPAKSDTPIGWDWDTDDEELPPLATEKVIPEPGVLRGMVIVFLAGLSSGFVALGLADELGKALPRGDEVFRIAIYAGWLAVGVVTLTGFVALLIPTTLARAALVAFFTQLLYAALTVLIWAPLYLGLR